MAEATMVDRNRVVIPLDKAPQIAKQDTTRQDRFEVLDYNDDGPIVYRKWVSDNALVADFIPDANYPWVEQTTDVPDSIKDLQPRLFITERGESRPIHVDDGMILTFWGRPHRKVGRMPDGTLLSEDESELREEVNNRTIPRYTEWCFRLKQVVFTDGPKLTRRLHESNDQQRARAETSMFEKQQQFFESLMGRLGVDADKDPSHEMKVPSSPADLFKMAMNMPTGQRENLMTLLVSELEEEADEASEPVIEEDVDQPRKPKRKPQ